MESSQYRVGVRSLTLLEITVLDRLEDLIFSSPLLDDDSVIKKKNRSSFNDSVGNIS